MEIIAYEMRKSLDIEPYDFLSYYEQISEKSKDIFLLICEEEIIGSVACDGSEIDDLIVSKKFQNKGYGKQLLLWGMNHIRQTSNEPISLHVAKWNEKALMLYKKVDLISQILLEYVKLCLWEKGGNRVWNL